MNQTELAERWLEKNNNGTALKDAKSNKMFFEGRVIYSYGYHYAIAIAPEFGGQYLVNDRSYSNTTGKHRANVAHALNKKGLSWKYEEYDVVNKLAAAIRAGKNPIVVEKVRIPNTISELQDVMIASLKSQGYRLPHQRVKKFCSQARGIIVGKAL